MLVLLLRDGRTGLDDAAGAFPPSASAWTTRWHAVRDGESAVLVLRGEAGIGKTALLQYAADRATDCRVLRIAGVESELELPFAALHQLCAPLLGDLGALPEPQEQALRVALGLAAGRGPGPLRRGPGRARACSPRSPPSSRSSCLVDDAQWLDEPSRQVLGVAGRRLLAESVLLLLAVRETGEDRLFPGAAGARPSTGWTADDARALLAAAVPGPLDERVRDRLVAETRGNPLALLELVRGDERGGAGGRLRHPGDATLPRPPARALPAPGAGAARAHPAADADRGR